MLSIDGGWNPPWERAEFGDEPGHPFRGNQWTGGYANERLDADDYYAYPDDPLPRPERAYVDRPEGTDPRDWEYDLKRLQDPEAHGTRGNSFHLLDPLVKEWGYDPTHWVVDDRTDIYEGDNHLDTVGPREHFLTKDFFEEWPAVREHLEEVIEDPMSWEAHGEPVGTGAAGWESLGDHFYEMRPGTTAALEMGEAAGHPFRGNQWTDGEGAVDVTGLKYGGRDGDQMNLSDDKRIQTGVPVKLTGLHVADHRGADIEKNGFSDPMQSGGKAGAGTYFHIAGDRTGDYAHFMRAGNVGYAPQETGRQFAVDIKLDNPVVIRVGSDLRRDDLLGALAEVRGRTYSETVGDVARIAGPGKGTSTDVAISQLFQRAGHDGLLILKESVGNGFGSMAVVYDTKSIDVKDVKPIGAGHDKTLAAALELGDYEGHPFRGNQWTTGHGEEKDESKAPKEKVGRTGESNRAIVDRLVRDSQSMSRPHAARMVKQLGKLAQEHPSIKPNVTTGPGTIADLRAAYGVTYLTKNTGLEISLNSATLSKEGFKEIADNKTFSYATRTPEGLATHEWAHAAIAQLSHDGAFGADGGRWKDAPGHYGTGQVWSANPDTVLREFTEDTGNRDHWFGMAKGISSYAAVNQVEFMAEAYASGKLDALASPSAVKFTDWLDTRIKLQDANYGMVPGEHQLIGSIDGGWSPPWERVELGDFEGHPFRGNQWTDAAGELDTHRGPATAKDSMMALFSPEIQAKIEKQVGKLGVDRAQGTANVRDLLERARGGSNWNAGMGWYGKAHDDAITIAERNGIDQRSINGALAAISPGQRWEEETTIVNSMAEYVANDSSVELSPERFDLLKEKAEALGETLEQGQKFSTMSDELAIMAMRQQHIDDGGTGWGIGYGYGNFAKGLDILRGTDPDEALNGVKVRNFYNNIHNPDGNDVTVDVQMVQAFANNTEKQNDSSLMGSPSVSRVGVGKTEIGPTPIIADAIRDVANEYGILPNQAQAIAWLQWREDHPPASKR